jgi:hypothetical protein
MNNNFEETLNEELKNLHRDIAPGRDLWSGIDHAINVNSKTSNTIAIPKYLAIAASIMLSVSLAFSGGMYFSRPQPDNQGITNLISLLQSEHDRNKQSLLVEYQDRTALAPDWESQMQQLEQAEAAIYEALRDDPENIELLKILRQVQTKQIQLIESVYAPLFTSI